MEKHLLFFCHKLLPRKYALGTLVLPGGAASMDLKNKLVGGTKTGPTGHGSLGLAHKLIINF